MDDNGTDDAVEIRSCHYSHGHLSYPFTAVPVMIAPPNLEASLETKDGFSHPFGFVSNRYHKTTR
jgi:hypothetical protein